MDWRELLQQQIESTVKSDFTWSRPSRRSWHMDAVMPGMKPGEQIDVVIGIDTSGSITDTDLKIFLSEIQGIMDSFPAYKIHVISFDTEVYNPVQYDSDNLDSMIDYNPAGGGGTDFDAIFDYLKRVGNVPKRLICFTDGYPCGSWGDADYCDTMFVIHGSTTIEAPFGITTYYELSKEYA